jgi:hypothetical protein
MRTALPNQTPDQKGLSLHNQKRMVHDGILDKKKSVSRELKTGQYVLHIHHIASQNFPYGPAFEGVKGVVQILTVDDTEEKDHYMCPATRNCPGRTPTHRCNG